MDIGIYYAFWDHEWQGDFYRYIPKVKKLGFDVLEVPCGDFNQRELSFFKEARKRANDAGIKLSGGYGPRPEHNLATEDLSQLEKTFAFWNDVFTKMETAGIDRIGGALYSYWPVDFSQNIDKRADTERSIRNMQKLADMAAGFGISLNMEVLNRFEGYMLNTCAECVDYVKEVNRPNVKVMLDSFHMNIEEDSFEEAILLAGPLLGNFHVGEANRKPPYAGGRMPWKSIGQALKEINYQGYVVMEPFVMQGGGIGKDISVWRDLLPDHSEAALDQAAMDSVHFLKKLWA